MSKNEALLKLALDVLGQSKHYLGLEIDKTQEPLTLNGKRYFLSPEQDYHEYELPAKDTESRYTVNIKIRTESQKVFLDKKRTKTGIRIFGITHLGYNDRTFLNLKNTQGNIIFSALIREEPYYLPPQVK